MKRIPDKKFAKSFFLRNLLKFVPLVIGIILMTEHWKNLTRIEFITGIVSFLFSIGYWAWEDQQKFKSYHCPRCKKHLPEMKIKHPTEGDPITYVCTTCNIEWDTLLRK